MIEFQEEKYSDKEIFGMLHPLLKDWFKEKFESFTEPQKYAIPNIHNKKNTLISAVTGSGKTLSAFTAILNELITAAEINQLEAKVYAVYISPLKALNNDIKRNLLEPLKEIEEKFGEKQQIKKKRKLGIRVAVRTGDTTQSERSSMLKKPPHILITTPESLAIILNAPKFRENLRESKWLIIDEIHALAGNKRGSHLSISMERLQKLFPEITRIGLSATIAPIKEIAKFLVGLENGKERNCKIVEAKLEKKLNLKVISPLPNLIDVSQEKIYEKLYELLDSLI